MIELVFMACLKVDLATCREQSVTLMGDGLTPMQCMMVSQQQLAVWARDNPRWHVQRWSCRPARVISRG